MTGQIVRLEQLEARFERLRLAEQDLANRVARAEQQIRDTQSALVPQTTSTITTYEITSANAVVIAAGSSGTATVSVRTGSSLSTFGSGITIYNDMQSATVASKTIMLYPNSDGSFTVLTQSC